MSSNPVIEKLPTALSFRVVASPGYLGDSLRYFCEVVALMMKRFKDLSEKEILAVAISNEEEDGRIYGEFADALRDSYPATAEIFEGMRVEEAGHRDRLLALFR